ncbi:MAG: T9SS type A sorting domain-containing protein [Bacteroidota bacterium]
MSRKITTLSLLLVMTQFLCSDLYAQHFEWAASASNIDLRYNYSSVDFDNNIVVGGIGRRNRLNRNTVEIYDGFGEVLDLKGPLLDHANAILSFSADGKVNWTYLLDARYTQLFGITHDQKGNTILLVNLEELDEDDDGNPLGSIPKITGDELIPVGFHLIYLNRMGRYLKMHQIFKGKQPEIDDISEFKLHPNGGLILTGFVDPGDFCDELDIEVGEGGGNFLLFLDEQGNPLWGDVVSYARDICCTYSANMCKAAVGGDGTIYFGGSYIDGGIFGGTVEVKAPRPAVDDEKKKVYEIYVASYSIQGKLNWVKTSRQEAIFHGIAAGDNGVFIGYRIYKVNDAFGQEVDTVGHKMMVLSYFNSKGEMEWMRSTGAERSHDLKTDDQNNLYVLGTFHQKVFNNSGVIGTDTLSKENDVFIARFSEKGEYQWVKEARIPIVTNNEPLRMLMDNCNNMYVTGTLWFVLPSSMSYCDKAFIRGKGHGAAPLIARFENTIPAKNEEESCVVSPGPWKIRNYPNPFRGTTEIEYELTYPDASTLEIHNLNGQRMHTLFSNKYQQAGKYQFQFNQPLVPGTYLAIIRGTETIATCKMVVVK